MNCDESRSFSIHHAHGELAAAERGPLLRHLGRCSACALEYCRLLGDLDDVQSSLEAPPAALGRKIRAAIARELRPRGVRRVLFALRRPIPAYALASALLIPIALWARHEVESGRGGASDPSPTRSVDSARERVPPASGAVGRSLPQGGYYDAAGSPLAASPIS